MPQSVVVNVNDARSTVAAPGSPDVTDTDTSADGCVANLTVNVSDPSSPMSNDDSLTTKFAMSSSVTDTATDAVSPA